MLNKIELCGRLTKTPELKAAGAAHVCEFTLAVERDYKKNGETTTDFIDCVAWNRTAEYVANYGEKGRTAIVCGALNIRKYTDKQGNARTAAEVTAENVYLIGQAKTAAGTANNTAYDENPAPAQNNAFAFLNDEDSDLPF